MYESVDGGGAGVDTDDISDSLDNTPVDVLSWVISHTLGHKQQHLTSMVSVFWASLWPFILAIYLGHLFEFLKRLIWFAYDNPPSGGFWQPPVKEAGA